MTKLDGCTWRGARVGVCPYCGYERPDIDTFDESLDDRDMHPRELLWTWYCPVCREVWFTVAEIDDWRVVEYE